MSAIQQLLVAGGSNALPSSTWDPLKKGTAIALSSGNMVATKITSDATFSVLTTNGKSTGKWYGEIVLGGGAGGPFNLIGVGTAAMDYASFLGFGTTSWGYYQDTGDKYTNNVAATFGASFTPGDVLGVALDADAGYVWFAKNNVWQGSGNPAAGTNPAFTGLPGGVFLGASVYAASLSHSATLRPTAGSQTYSPPSGFTAWG